MQSPRSFGGASEPNGLRFLEGGGQAGALIRSIAWGATSLGALESWPATLRVALSIMLRSRHPMFLWWGPELIQLYNDAYIPSLGDDKHPSAMGQRGPDCWPGMSAQIHDVMQHGSSSWYEDQLIPIERAGVVDDAYWTYACSPVVDDDGMILGALVVCQETTAKVLQRRAQQQVTHGDELERMRQQLREHSEQEKHILGMVSHDLRTPLQVVSLGISYLVENPLPTPFSVQVILRIQSAARRSVRMLDDLMDFTQARLGGGLAIQPQPADLHDIANSVRQELSMVHPDRTLEVFHEGAGRGAWDRDRIEQLLMNLLSNAIHYGAPSEPVTLRTGGDDAHVWFSVHNRGTPIPRSAQSSLFLPMQRATSKNAGRSIGLGLYIVAEIAKRHGGSVTVASSHEGGTVFSVQLPRFADAPSA